MLPSNWLSPDNVLNCYVDIRSGKVVDNQRNTNKITRFHGFEPHKFCFDRLNYCPEFSALIPNKKIERLMKLREFMETQVVTMHPFSYKSKIYYIVMLNHLKGLFVYDEFLKPLGNGINVRDGRDYYCQIGQTINNSF